MSESDPLVELLAQITGLSAWERADRVRAAGYMTEAEWEAKRPQIELPRYAPLSHGSWSVLHKQGWDAAREYLAGEVAQ